MKTWMGWVFCGVVLLWLVFGNPGSSIAGWFWPETNAPWEQVNAFYYPDSGDLTQDKRQMDVGSVEACRDWVDEQARAVGDPDMLNGDYECGVGCKEMGEGMFMCRLTIE